MHAPKHVIINPYGVYRNYTINWYSAPKDRIVLVHDHDDDLPSGYFYDTDRGIEEINDCVHAKVVGPKVANDQVSFTSIDMPDGLKGLPQGTWHSGYGTYYSNYTRQYWWHKMLEIPRLGIRRPVLVIVRYDYRVEYRGLLDYRYWGVDCRAAMIYSDPKPDIFSRYMSYNCLVSFKCEANSPLKVRRISENNEYTLPAGYYVPGTHVPERSYSLQSAIDLMDESMDNNIMSIVNYFDIGHGSTGNRETLTGALSYVVPASGKELFMLNEDLMIVDKISDRVDPNPNVYWRNWLVQHAYLAAIQSVPTLNDNSISNILEIVGFIKSLVIDHEINVPKRLSDLWLSYRYTYNTGKSDIEDAISFMKRYTDLGGLERSIKCRGLASTAVMGTDVTCRCTLDIEPTDLGFVGKIWRALENYGLTPDFYVIWDMIPYSFIVDWFIPIGDLLSVVDAERRFSGSRYTISNVCFSLSYRRSIDGYDYKLYSRWRADPLESFNLFYWFDKPKVDSKVTMYRILDTVSLVIGG